MTRSTVASTRAPRTAAAAAPRGGGRSAPTFALWTVLFASVSACGGSADGPAADLIVINANVWTVDRDHPRAEAIAVIGDRIAAVGDAAQIDAWRGSETIVVDAEGRLVLPGFNDAHVHLVQAGQQLDNVHLKDADSPEEFTQRIADFAAGVPAGEWILGGDWDEQLWTPPDLPTRQLIDRVTPNHPVYIIRYDGHQALANTRALELAGITVSTTDPPGGEILRDGAGAPTGILKMAARDLVAGIVPPLSPEQRRRAATRALEQMAAAGVTSATDMGTSADDTALFMELESSGLLTTRLYLAPMETDWQDQANVGIRRGFGSTFLRLGALKGYVDGSLGSSTALFFEPYLHEPESTGMLTEEFTPFADARTRLLSADDAGLQIALHAIGDRGISMTLDLFEELAVLNGPRDRRLRIEHAQHLVEADFARFAELDIIASVQPYHAVDDGRWAEDRIGPDRAKTTYAFRTFLDHGVRLAVGTDWNGAPIEPMLTLHAAVTRATLDGRHPNGWVPEQKLTLDEAIEAYTLGSAYAEFQEQDKGTIERGKLADLVVLSDDIFSIPPEDLPMVSVVTTIVGGQIVYSADTP